MLDTYLASFFLNVRKAGSGSEVEDVDRQYEPCTMMAIHSSIHRYLSLKAYGHNIKEDDLLLKEKRQTCDKEVKTWFFSYHTPYRGPRVISALGATAPRADMTTLASIWCMI